MGVPRTFFTTRKRGGRRGQPDQDEHTLEDAGGASPGRGAIVGEGVLHKKAHRGGEGDKGDHIG